MIAVARGAAIGEARAALAMMQRAAVGIVAARHFARALLASECAALAVERVADAGAGA